MPARDLPSCRLASPLPRAHRGGELPSEKIYSLKLPVRVVYEEINRLMLLLAICVRYRQTL